MTATDRLNAIKDSIVRQAEGREFLPLALAATIARCHANTLRRAVASGALKASRRAVNGPLTFWAHDVAEWMVRGESLAAPAPRKPRLLRRRRSGKGRYADGGTDLPAPQPAGG